MGKREVGKVLGESQAHVFKVSGLSHRTMKATGKQEVTVYVTFDEGLLEYWLTQRDVASLYGCDVKGIQSMVAQGRVSAAEKRRLPGVGQESLLSVVKWRQLVFSYKPFAPSCKIMRAEFNALLRSLAAQTYEWDQQEQDSTVLEKEEEEPMTKSTWTPAKREVSPSQATPLLRVGDCELPKLTIYKVLIARYTPEQILAGLRRLDSRISDGAKLKMTSGGEVEVEWETVE